MAKADAAFDDSLDRGAHESVKEDRMDSEGAALLALLQTKPETLAGALRCCGILPTGQTTMMRVLFQHWNGEKRSAGKAFLPMVVDAIEVLTRR